MFKVVAERRKRRVWSKGTVAASVAAHLLIAGGLLTAAETRDREPQEVVIDLPIPIEPTKPAHADPPPPPETPRTDPAPVKGQTIVIPAPETVPTTIPEPDPNAKPITAVDVTGIGKPGDVIGPVDPRQTATATGNNNGDADLPVFPEVIEVEKADVKPELANQRQAEMLLQRNYPAALRDAGATGRTTVELIIDAEGKVEPGSVKVQDSSNEAFNEAAVRAVERFRFRPAMYRGRAVPVLVTLPIEWTLQN